MSSRVVLMTGSTGFLGGALLAEAWRHRKDTRWLLLVRNRHGVAAKERVMRSIARFGPTVEDWPDQFEVIEGDLHGLPDLSKASITHVVHLAANTSFRSTSTVWRVNHDGTRRLVDVLERLPRLVRVLYVGTAMSCGVGPPGLVDEDEPHRDDAEHIVEYTRSKAAAERLMVESGLPWIMARPSIVVGHTKLGIRPSSSIYWVFRAIELLGTIRWAGATLIDVVPVDWAARALELLLFAPSLGHRTYHLSAGSGAAVDWDAIHMAFAAADGCVGGGGYRLDKRAVDARKNEFVEMFGSCDPDRVAVALSLYYRFAGLGRVFDNRRVLSEGISPPPPFSAYLPLCVATESGRSVADMMLDDE